MLHVGRGFWRTVTPFSGESVRNETAVPSMVGIEIEYRERGFWARFSGIA